MGTYVNDAVLDAAWAVIKSATSGQITVCSSQPTTRSQAITSYALAATAFTSANFTGPTSGSSGGRKLTVSAFNSVSVDSSGSAKHVALVSGTALLYVTTCTTQSLTSGNKVNIPSWKMEIGDPVAS